MKQKLIRLLLTTAICTLMIGTTGCGGPKESGTAQVNNTEPDQFLEIEKNADSDNQNPEQEIDKESMVENEDDANMENTGNDNTDGFSSIYADSENRMFKINGKTYTLGKSTIQDLIDNGVELKGINGTDKNIEPNCATGVFSIMLNGDANYTCNVNAANFTDEKKIATECLITSIYIHSDSDVIFVENTLEFAFPLDITEEELRANSGEPSDFNEFISDNSDYSSRTLDYKWESTDNRVSTGYSFKFEDGKLALVIIDYEP